MLTVKTTVKSEKDIYNVLENKTVNLELKLCKDHKHMLDEA